MNKDQLANITKPVLHSNFGLHILKIIQDDILAQEKILERAAADKNYKHAATASDKIEQYVRLVERIFVGDVGVGFDGRTYSEKDRLKDALEVLNYAMRELSIEDL